MTPGRVGLGRLGCYCVNFEIDAIKSFPLAFPRSKGPNTLSNLPSFDGESMASFSDHTRLFGLKTNQSTPKLIRTATAITT